MFHTSLLLILALVAEAVQPTSPDVSLHASIGGPAVLDGAIDEVEVALDRSTLRRTPGNVGLVDPEVVMPKVEFPSEEPLASDRPTGAGVGPVRPLLAPDSDMPVGGGLEGRGREARAQLVRQWGGNADSEAAVERGLRWLAAYQRADGSWNFDHNKGRTSGFSSNPGKAATTTGATAIALAAFLGAGYSHLEGPYQETVRHGVYYLRNRALVTPQGVDLQEGTMYGQGLAAIALCEAYAMTGDPGLKDIAQGTIDFIDYAQDKRGGGWRYAPCQPGDTTVTGWQLMALKSGQMARLEVPSPSIFLAARFLDSVSCDEGARYGYMSSEPRRTTTAIGLLCRMHTGWKRDHPGLQRGVAYLAEWGPSDDNMYYNYYATQVLRHWAGPEWEEWNPKMRDYLIATQSREGFDSGSWYFSGGYGDVGGRLYNTAMAIMTLEVYYRYMPLYQPKAFEQ